jgi:hypothetical protein
MKRIQHLLAVLILIIPIVSLSCKQNGEKSNLLPSDIVQNPNSASGSNDTDLPVIEFKDDFYDFGKIIQGEKVSYSFKFTNKGKSDLIISNVTSSCGCTIGAFPKIPIKPGESNKIEVMFDSENRRGFQSKTITVLSNAQPSTTTLRIKSQVILPEETNQ